MRYQINEKIGPWVNDAIQSHGQGEEIGWEPSLMPGEQGEALFVCFFWMPGAVLGTQMQGSFMVRNPLTVTREEISDTVRDFLREMRTARSQQIEANAPSGSPQEALRGTQRPSGLLIP